MDIASRENGPARGLAAVDQHELFAISHFSRMGIGFAGRAGANRKPYFDFDFYPIGELYHLPADQRRLPAHSAAKNRNRAFHHRASFVVIVMIQG